MSDYWDEDDVDKGLSAVINWKDNLSEELCMLALLIIMLGASILMLPFWLIGRMTPPKKTRKRRR